MHDAAQTHCATHGARGALCEWRSHPCRERLRSIHSVQTRPVIHTNRRNEALRRRSMGDVYQRMGGKGGVRSLARVRAPH